MKGYFTNIDHDDYKSTLLKHGVFSFSIKEVSIIEKQIKLLSSSKTLSNKRMIWDVGIANLGKLGDSNYLLLQNRDMSDRIYIYKLIDEYYLIVNVSNANKAKESQRNYTYYKCDQMDGLLEYIKTIDGLV